MTIICAAMEEQNLAQRYRAKSRFLSTANPPWTPWELKREGDSERRSQAQFTQTWVVVGTAPQRPMIFALTFRNRQIVDAGDTQSHQAVLVEFPVFVAVAAKPMTAVVVPLVGKSHGYSVLAKRPEFFNQPIVEFAGPLAREKRLDGIAALQKFGAVAPTTVGRIGKRDPSGVARVPRVLRHARFLGRGFQGKGRQGWSVHTVSSLTGAPSNHETFLSASAAGQFAVTPHDGPANRRGYSSK